jgi:protocatechuate 3,4-dioxygenase beta subunit
MPNETLRVSRRDFLRGAGVAAAAVSAFQLGGGLLAGCAVSRGAGQAPAAEEPSAAISWRTVLTSADEPGEPLVVSGKIFGPDGKTPVDGALIHVYHTDARGIYSERDGQGGPPDPRIKGWMKTGADGRYEFRTIKPASYPGSRIPAHIHSKVSAPGHAERWIHEFWFEGDPFIASESKRMFEGQGAFSPVMSISRGADGVLRCARDIRLERV